jgi:hypothetical protein
MVADISPQHSANLLAARSAGMSTVAAALADHGGNRVGVDAGRVLVRRLGPIGNACEASVAAT